MKKYNIAKDFSINISGLCIPKNAIYGKYTHKNNTVVYWYVDEYKQFSSDKKSLCVHILRPQDKHFHKHFVTRHRLEHLHKMIIQNNLQDVTCVYPLKLGKRTTDTAIHGFVSARQAQAEFIFRPSNQDTKHAITDYACGKLPNWVAY